MAVRIGGLVRAYGRIQEQLRSGIAPAEAEAFRREVRALTDSVDAICRRQRSTPEQLPAPSRRVYRFLKNLDLAALPPPQPGAPAPAAALRVSNLLAVGAGLSQRFWQESAAFPSAAVRGELRATLERHALDVERICAEAERTPAALPAPSRAIYCWLAFLAGGDHLDLHLQALRRARRGSDAARRPRSEAVVHLAHTAVLWRARPLRTAGAYPSGEAALSVSVNEGFLGMDEGGWQALLQQALGAGSAAARQVVESYAGSEAFSAVAFELASYAAAPADARGRVHDLEASFARINAAYFDGRLERPALRWSTVPTARTFGHYQPARDTLMISASLDAAAVPDFVVDHVMHHELLHKQLGITVSNGRLSMHGAAFRAAERRYRRYAEADRFLKALAGSL